MPAFLAEANHRKSIDTMIEVYGDEAKLYEYWDSSELQAMLKKNIQIASCEQVFLDLAESLEGYNIYISLPFSISVVVSTGAVCFISTSEIYHVVW